MSGRYVTAKVARDLDRKLTERDLAITRSVCELRFVSGAQLARMHFMDADPRAVRRTLLRLTRLDVLERLDRQVGGVRAGSAGFVYRLGLAGQRLALERGWISNRRRRRSRIPGMLFMNHALQVAELHARLAEAASGGRIELLELRAEPACWRAYGGVGAQPLVLKPDSFLRVGAGEFEDSYFIEVDMGSEGSRALMRQLMAYVAYYDSGREQAEHGVFPKVLWLAPDAGRVSAIEDCVRRLPREQRELFAAIEFGEAEKVVTNTPTEEISEKQ
ncbi:MAG TPA: replication-relaxation family protein [Solirubrobacterales bacterium]